MGTDYSVLAPPVRTRRVLYTGRTIHATDGSRSVIAGAPPVGGVLIRDPYTHDAEVRGAPLGGASAVNDNATSGNNGQFVQGNAYTRPQTGLLYLPTVLIVKVERPIQAGDNKCWVEVVDVAESAQALVTLSSAALVPGTILGPVAGQFHLGILAVSNAAEIVTALQIGCAKAIENVGSTTGTALRLVSFGGLTKVGN